MSNQNPHLTNKIKPLPAHGVAQNCIWMQPEDVHPKIADMYKRYGCKGTILMLEDKRDVDSKAGWFIYAMLYRLHVSKGLVKYVVQVGDKVLEEKDPQFKETLREQDFACSNWIIEDLEAPQDI